MGKKKTEKSLEEGTVEMEKKTEPEVVEEKVEETPKEEKTEEKKEGEEGEKTGCECNWKCVEKKVFGYVRALPKKYFITAFSGMAQGLFVTLIAGTIFAQIAGWIGDDNFFGRTFLYIANIAKSLMGAGIGVGIAHALGKNKLLMFFGAVSGMVGAFADKLFDSMQTPFTTIALGAPGNPIGAYVVTMLVVELVGNYAGKTKLDILIVPLGGLILGFIGIFVAYPFIWLVNQLGRLVALATDATPAVMGIVCAVLVGILLTLPTSSAAIWVAVSSPVLKDYAPGSIEYEAMLLAGGAATVGCACHMVGFAVATFRENGISGLISQGIGTSMLQIPNVMRHPIILVPMIVSSAILGPISSCAFKLKCGASGGGMGTSGLVGIFDLFNYTTGALGYTGIILEMIVFPAILNFGISELMRKLGWLKPEYMRLPK